MLLKLPYQPKVVAYGLGVDSTAMLTGLARRGIRPDLILFADTGSEKEETYNYEPVMQDWLKREGFPPIIVVRYIPKNFKNWPPYYTLEDNCLTNGTLPGISFGPPSCSIKWKQAPQNAYCDEWQPARDCWAAGEKVTKMIGFDAGPIDRRRTFPKTDSGRGRYDYLHPLIEWGWDREECKRQIAAAGLPVPPKSSCWFCCAMKPWEVDALPADKLRRIVRMEARANPRLRTCEGLWRSTVKGTRGGTPKPGSMTKYIRDKGMLPPEEIDHIWNTTPQDIIEYQEGYAAALESGKVTEFVEANASKDYRSL